jgi:hypothetical protein
VGVALVSNVSQTAGVVTVVAAAALLASHGGGLYGHVVIDPARPVCMVGQSCAAPDPYDLLTFRRGTRIVRRARTRADGAYRVRLPAGVYAVAAARASAGIGRGLRPVRVRVKQGRYTRADFVLDIGIR